MGTKSLAAINRWQCISLTGYLFPLTFSTFHANAVRFGLSAHWSVMINGPPQSTTHSPNFQDTHRFILTRLSFQRVCGCVCSELQTDLSTSKWQNFFRNSQSYSDNQSVHQAFGITSFSHSTGQRTTSHLPTVPQRLPVRAFAALDESGKRDERGTVASTSSTHLQCLSKWISPSLETPISCEMR